VPVEPLVRAIRSPGSHLLIVADAAAEWIPVAGDIYGVAKMAYDPRIERTIRPKADAVAADVKARLRRECLDPLRDSIPTSAQLSDRLRAAFSAPRAVAVLNEREAVR
jgi:hypothetical protein